MKKNRAKKVSPPSSTPPPAPPPLLSQNVHKDAERFASKVLTEYICYLIDDAAGLVNDKLEPLTAPNGPAKVEAEQLKEAVRRTRTHDTSLPLTIEMSQEDHASHFSLAIVERDYALETAAPEEYIKSVMAAIHTLILAPNILWKGYLEENAGLIDRVEVFLRRKSPAAQLRQIFFHPKTKAKFSFVDPSKTAADELPAYYMGVYVYYSRLSDVGANKQFFTTLNLEPNQ